MASILAAALAAVMVAGLPGAAQALPTETPQPDLQAGGAASTIDLRNIKTENDPETKEQNAVRQLTWDDIDAMNDGDCAMLFTDDYLTFLRGRYYDQKVTNYEEAIESLYGMQSLLGLNKGSEYFCVYGQTDETGYTSYTYLQRYGDITIQNAVLKIFVDPEGYTCGLVSSLTPNLGIAPKDESSITAEEAIEVVKTVYPGGKDLKYFPEQTRQTSITDINGITSHCWAVFTKAPEGSNVIEGPAYLEHLISYEGDYLYYMSVNSPEELVFGEDVMTEVALTWFSGLQSAEYTGVVTKHDGTQKKITVPVAYDPVEDVYYLADVKRHILLSDYYRYMVEGKYDPFISKDNTGWPDVYLLTYDSYIKIYDFYEMLGIQSIDDFGAPIIILTDWCSEDAARTPVYNAAFLGYALGWAMFGASSIGNFGECVDVIGHEFTHGVCNYAMSGWNYTNENGAIMEALSDIMGNLIEMILGETEDTTWLISENSGEIFRSMSVPWLHQQPVTIGGRFYIPPTDIPSDPNDYGGVHTNSSLVNYVAWKLHEAGMDPMLEIRLYKEVIGLLTPLSGFREFHQALLFAGEMIGLDVEWLVRIDMYCEEAGY